jgi:ABC-type uncharacterized transport system substrate-binding protein
VTQLQVAPKELELLRELLPTARVIGLLVNPADPGPAEGAVRAMQPAARTLGVELHVVQATTERDFDAAFAKLIQLRVDGLVIGGDPLFTGNSRQLGAMTVRYSMPAVYKGREFAAAGGLLSYGSDVADAYRLAGVYTGRILNGDRPADLPVQQATGFKLVINLKTAKALGLTVPQVLLARATEVIE